MFLKIKHRLKIIILLLFSLVIVNAFYINNEHLTVEQTDGKSYCKFTKDKCKTGWMNMDGGVWQAIIPGQQHKSGNKDTFQFNCSSNQLNKDDASLDYCFESNNNNEIILDRSGKGTNCLWGISTICGNDKIYMKDLKRIEFDIDIKKGTCSDPSSNNKEWFSLYMKPYNVDTGEIIVNDIGNVPQNEIDLLEVGTNINLDGPSTNFAGREPQKAWSDNGNVLKAWDGIQKHVTAIIDKQDDRYNVTVKICDMGSNTCNNESIVTNSISTWPNDNEDPMMFIVDNWVTNLDRESGLTKFESNCNFSIKKLLVVRKDEPIPKPPINKYECDNGNCKESQNGQYASLNECESNCNGDDGGGDDGGDGGDDGGDDGDGTICTDKNQKTVKVDFNKEGSACGNYLDGGINNQYLCYIEGDEQCGGQKTKNDCIKNDGFYWCGQSNDKHKFEINM
jgi:hypothetical protein